MPADYEEIRAENIRRYGWDTAVLDLLGQLYSERTHFIFELIQNAEDAGATELAFELFPDRLEVRHDGRPFTEGDVRGVCGVGQSEKSGDLTQIGKFGIGFKSVYAYTRTPRIHSGGEHFRIESFVRPFAVSPADAGTLFVFPFDHDEVPPSAAVEEISAALRRLDLGTLLFLRNIERVRVGGLAVAEQILRRVAAAGRGSRRQVTLARRGEGVREDAQWLVWHRPLAALGQPGQRVEIAFRAGAGEPRLAGVGESPLVVFFPTEKETFLGFLIQGPYRTTPARDNVPEHDPWNQDLVRESAALLAGVLREVRDDGLLTVDVLQALPLDAARFPPGAMLRALFESARAALREEELIPAAGGGYGAARDLKLAGGAGLRELLPGGLLGELYGDGQLAGFADESVTENGTPLLWRYLREEIGVGEVTPEAVVTRASREFLTARTDAWIASYYAFLYRYPVLWAEPEPALRPELALAGPEQAGLERGGQEEAEPGPHGRQAGSARRMPIMRLEDGSQVVPFDASGRPAVYLPGPVSLAAPAGLPGAAGTALRTVRRAVAGVPGARQFLTALGFTEPDVVAEVLDSVLPRYCDLDPADLDAAQHEADLESVARALAEAPAGRREELLDRLRETPFLIAENAATGDQRLMAPPRLYQRSRELEIYFGGNPDAWFAADTYGPWLVQLRGMGVRDEVELRIRRPDLFGYVVVVSEFARHERGIDGFDPGAELDGLDFALRHPGQARSEYVWNTLLAPRRQLVAGVVEKASRQEYQDARSEHVLSVTGAVATSMAWLPGPDGTFRRPAELTVDDLPPAYERDETLARALGMVPAVIGEASRQLGIPPDVLRGLSQHPDLVAMVERELKQRAGGEGS